jgi:rubrerythrin
MADQQTIDALGTALDDEYRARATYRKVIERFGPVPLFVDILAAENRHIAALLAQFRRLGAAPPLDAWDNQVATPKSLAQACAQGVQAEVENDVLYDRLLGRVSDPEARSLMLRLQRVSRTRHLPAFRRCLELCAGRRE